MILIILIYSIKPVFVKWIKQN